MAAQGDDHRRQVFINCPFDEKYRELLRPLLFTVCYLGLRPRIASESLDSSQNRIEKICNLIRISDFSIHDLSRCVSAGANEYYRMNMPFEFGLDYGRAYFNAAPKCMLAMEGRRYDFQKALSDLAGVDVKCHSNEPRKVVSCIRDWIIEAGILSAADSPTIIWYAFSDFALTFYEERKAKGFSDEDLNDMPAPEYIAAIENWLANRRL